MIPIPGAAVKAKPKPVVKTTRAAPKCLQLIRLSKQHRAGTFEFIPVKDCKCECKADGRVQVVLKAKYKVAFRLDSMIPCDETDLPNILPVGSELLLEGALLLRQEPCAHDQQLLYLGTNEGTATLRRSPNDVVFEEPFLGTVGIHPSKSGDERCCAHGQMVGSLNGLGKGVLKNYSLCLSYDILVFILDRINLCEPGRADARLNLDGVLVRTCPPPPPPARTPAKKKK